MIKKIAPTIEIPDIGFEFLAGLSDPLIKEIETLLLNEYKKAFSNELELVSLPGSFAFDSIKEPFVGFIWFKKTRRANYKYNLKHKSKRNFIMPICNIGINHSLIVEALQEKIEEKGGEIRHFASSIFEKKLFNLYKNIYEVAYYNLVLDKELDPLRKRVIAYRASDNKKLIWRWSYGATLFGIKLVGGNFLYSLIKPK